MYNFREVNDDILRDWLSIREQEVFCTLTGEDKKHHIYFDELSENILKNVPKQNQKYVKKQLEILDKNFMDYLSYWNEKYYRNSFVDGVQIISGYTEEKYSIAVQSFFSGRPLIWKQLLYSAYIGTMASDIFEHLSKSLIILI